MRVALIGPPQSGKSTLFAAVAEAGGSHVDPFSPRPAPPAVVKVPTSGWTWLSELYHPKKYTPAELEFLDLPGFDLADEAGRTRARQHWAAMRQSDMLVFVLRAFESPTVPAYRSRVDFQADLEELMGEMLFADLDQVTHRIEKLEAAAKKPTAKKDEHLREMELMKRLSAALEEEKSIAQAITSDAEGKLVRSFSFLSQKPRWWF
jgi:ribosome-binding ATPase YchF (GTP1/OBG family)